MADIMSVMLVLIFIAFGGVSSANFAPGATSSHLDVHFNATYTIVNKANGRRISASEREGFVAIDNGPIYEDQMWVVAPLENRSHAIVNLHNGMRILAKSGHDRHHGFYTIKDGPIYQDQRWKLTPQPDGSYTIVNAKSGRRILARSGELGWVSGFGAISHTEPLTEDQLWWLINQEKDESGRLMHELQGQKEMSLELQALVQGCVIPSETVSCMPSNCLSTESDPIDGSTILLVGGVVALCAIVAATLAFLYRRWMRNELARNVQMASDLQQERLAQTELASELQEQQARVVHLETEFELELSSMVKGGGGGYDTSSDFSFHMIDTDVDRETARLIKVQCPGVQPNDIEIGLIFNGCDVTIQRRASCGVEATTWTKRFQFRPADGLFEFKEDQMQLEHGFLHVVFRAYRFQSRVIRFPQQFSLATSDADKWWEYPEEGAFYPGGQPKPRKGRVTALKVSPDVLSAGKSRSHMDTESTASTSMADPGDLTRREHN